MNQEAKGVFLPYPLLGIMLTLVLILVGGIVGLYSQLSAMNTAMILRDADYQQRTKKLEDKIELQGMYITDVREKIIRVEERRKVAN